MKDQVKDGVEALTQDYTNTTGAALSAGNIVRVAGRFGKLVTNLAISATGAAKIAGEFGFTKATGTAFVVGQPLGWDFTNKRVTTDISGGVLLNVTKAAASGDTSVQGVLNGLNRIFKKVAVADSTDDTANSKDFDTGWGANPTGIRNAHVYTSAGVDRGVTTITFPSAGVIRVAQANLAATDEIHVYAELY